MSLRRTSLIQYLTYPPLRNAQFLTDFMNGPASFRRAQEFPRRLSFRMALSRDKSATIFFSLPFSVSSFFNRRA
jgi:hypothetical protein